MAEKREIILNIDVVAGDAQKQLEKVTIDLKNNRDELKALNKEFRNKEPTAEFAKQQSLLKTEIKKLSIEERGLRTDIINTEKATKAAEGSNEKLRAELSKLTRQYNKLGQEEREATQEGKDLTAQIRKLSNELKENEKAVGDNRRNVGNYAGALEDLAGGIGNNIAGLVGPAGLVAGVGLLSEKIVEGIQAVIDITKEFTKLRGETQKLTGETGQNLDELVVKIKAVSDVFDKDFNDVLISANALSKQLGISQDEAIGLIEKGFLSGADASGEFLSILEEYPAQLKTVGLSAEESVAIISQQVKSGIFTDKGIDTIKEAGLRLRELPQATRDALEGIGLSSEEIEKSLADGSKSLFDVIQEVSAEIDKLPENSAEVGTAIADIFGGPGEDAGLQFITTLQNAKTGLDSLVDPSNALTVIQQKQLAVTQELANAQNELSKVFEGNSEELDLLIKQGQIFLIETLIALINELKPAIEGLKTLAGWFTTLIDLLNAGRKSWNDFRESIGLARRDLDDTTTAGASLVSIFKLLTGQGIPDLLGSIGGKIGELIDDLKSLSNTFLGTDFEIDVKADKAADAVGTLTNSVDGLGLALQNLAGAGIPIEDEIKKVKRLTDEEVKEAQRAAEKRTQIALKERVSGIELALLEVRKGSEKELELQKKLIQAKSKLALNGANTLKVEQERILRQGLADRIKLESKFVDEASAIAKKGIDSKRGDIAKILSANLLANAQIIASDNEVKVNEKAATQEVLDAQLAAIAISEQAKQVSDILLGESQDESTRSQIEDINKILAAETASTEQRAALATKLSGLQKTKRQENFEQASESIQALNTLTIAAANIFEAQKNKELAAAENNEAKKSEINARFAKKEKRLAVFQAVLGASLSIISVLRNFTLLPEPVGTIQKLIAAATIGGAALTAVASIKSASFAGGGPTGSSGVSDPNEPGRKIVGVVHDNEYVIPTKVLKTTAGKSLAMKAEVMRNSFAIGGFTSDFNDGGIPTLEGRNSVTQSINVTTDLLKAIENLPPPEVSLKEITTLGIRVKVKEETSGI